MGKISKEGLEVMFDGFRRELERVVGGGEPDTPLSDDERRLVNKKTFSKIFDISCSETDRLIRAAILIEGKHFTRYSENGHKRFDVAECYNALKPERAGAKSSRSDSDIEKEHSDLPKSRNNLKRRYT